MAKSKKADSKIMDIKVDEKAPVDAPKKADYEAFKALIEAYKKQNPKKYEGKRNALKEQLAALK